MIEVQLKTGGLRYREHLSLLLSLTHTYKHIHMHARTHTLSDHSDTYSLPEHLGFLVGHQSSSFKWDSLVQVKDGLGQNTKNILIRKRHHETKHTQKNFLNSVMCFYTIYVSTSISAWLDNTTYEGVCMCVCVCLQLQQGVLWLLCPHTANIQHRLRDYQINPWD